MRKKRLREITKLAYSEPAALHSDKAAKTEWEDLISTMRLDHCMMRFDPRKHLYLCTDFSALSFNYVTTQPADDKDSLLAIRRRMAGDPYKFIAKGQVETAPSSFW